MSPIRSILFVLSEVAIFATSGYSQDLKAGEINLEHYSGLSYKATVAIYQHIPTMVNRTYIWLNWGDGTSDSIPLGLTGCGDTNTFGKICYSAPHTYPSTGMYTISCVDSFLMPNIQNISNSQSEKLNLQYELKINPTLGYNDSPISVCPDAKWFNGNHIYNPSCYDPDGDSLSYSLVPAFTTNYTFPPATSIDSVTGDMTFSPQAIGAYAFCLRVDEWRNQSTPSLIGTTFIAVMIEVQSLTGIEEISNNEFNIFPNPVSNYLVYSFSKPFHSAQLKLYNVQGVEVGKWELENSKEKSEIDVSELPNGIYFYSVIKDGSIIDAKGKIIVIH